MHTPYCNSSVWAAPKGSDGKIDHDNALVGDDLIDYVNRQLFPYLRGFKLRAKGANTIEYMIGEIFSEIKNRFRVAIVCGMRSL